MSYSPRIPGSLGEAEVQSSDRSVSSDAGAPSNRSSSTRPLSAANRQSACNATVSRSSRVAQPGNSARSNVYPNISSPSNMPLLMARSYTLAASRSVAIPAGQPSSPRTAAACHPVVVSFITQASCRKAT